MTLHVGNASGSLDLSKLKELAGLLRATGALKMAFSGH